MFFLLAGRCFFLSFSKILLDYNGRFGHKGKKGLQRLLALLILYFTHHLQVIKGIPVQITIRVLLVTAFNLFSVS